MSNSNHSGPSVPESNKAMLAAAGVILMIPIVALLAVPVYARETPRLFGFPFFFWYQFVWVFLCASMTYTAYRLVLAARGQSPRDDAEHDG